MGVDIKIPGTFRYTAGLPVLGPPVGEPYVHRFSSARLAGSAGDPVSSWPSDDSRVTLGPPQPAHTPELVVSDGRRAVRFNGETRLNTGSGGLPGTIGGFAIVFRSPNATSPLGIANWRNLDYSPAASDGALRLATTGQVNCSPMDVEEFNLSSGSDYNAGGWVAVAYNGVSAARMSVNGENPVALGTPGYGRIDTIWVGRESGVATTSPLDVAELILFGGSVATSTLKVISQTLASRYNG